MFCMKRMDLFCVHTHVHRERKHSWDLFRISLYCWMTHLFIETLDFINDWIVIWFNKYSCCQYFRQANTYFVNQPFTISKPLFKLVPFIVISTFAPLPSPTSTNNKYIWQLPFSHQWLLFSFHLTNTVILEYEIVIK